MAKSKAEIDKEIMYRKIMPSSTRSQPVHTEAPSSVSNMDSAPSPTSAGMADALRRSLTTPVQMRENKDSVLVNLMEELVLTRLDSTIQRFNCCRCDKCKKDIAALALVTGALVQAILVVKKEPRLTSVPDSYFITFSFHDILLHCHTPVQTSLPPGKSSLRYPCPHPIQEQFLLPVFLSEASLLRT